MVRTPTPPSQQGQRGHAPSPPLAMRAATVLAGYALCLPAALASSLLILSSLREAVDATRAASAAQLAANGMPLLPWFAPAAALAWIGFACATLAWLAGRRVPRWLGWATAVAGACALCCLGRSAWIPAIFALPAFATLAAAMAFPPR